MLPYLYVYIVAMTSSFFYDIKEFRRLKWFFCFGIVFSLSILYYVRDFSIGLDTYTYVGIIDDVFQIDSIKGVVDYSILYNIEIGFVFFVYLLGFLGVSTSLVFFVSALLIYINLFFALKKVKVNVVLYFSAFFSYCAFFLWSFNILRQMIAVSFVILAVGFLLNSSKRKFILFIILATLFHYSAIVGLLFYFIYHYLDFFFKFRLWLVFFICAISKFILLAVVSYYPRYASYGVGDTANSIGIFLFSFYLFIFLLLGVAGKYVKKKVVEYELFVSAFSIYIGLQLAFIINGISTYGTTRLLIYFLWPSVFIIGIFLINLKESIRYILNCLLFLLFTFYFLYSLNSSGYDYVPFRFLAGQ